MEKVVTLIQKLTLQQEQNAPVDQMLQTLQMLQVELLSSKTAGSTRSTSNVAIIMPAGYNGVNTESNETPIHEILGESEEKIIEVLQVDEKEIEEELEQIRKNAVVKNQMGVNAKPSLLFDPMEDVPTLTHQVPAASLQPEINDMVTDKKESLNETLNENRSEISHTLTEEPVKDLRKAIGVNDRFLYINELFRGDDAMYERSIKTINNFSILAEAEYWIRRELKVKIGWSDSDPVVKQFDQLVRRRFTSM